MQFTGGLSLIAGEGQTCKLPSYAAVTSINAFADTLEVSAQLKFGTESIATQSCETYLVYPLPNSHCQIKPLGVI